MFWFSKDYRCAMIPPFLQAVVPGTALGSSPVLNIWPHTLHIHTFSHRTASQRQRTECGILVAPLCNAAQPLGRVRERRAERARTRGYEPPCSAYAWLAGLPRATALGPLPKPAADKHCVNHLRHAKQCFASRKVESAGHHTSGQGDALLFDTKMLMRRSSAHQC